MSSGGGPPGATRPGTYSQNSMTGEVTFSEGVTVLAPERFRKSMQRSVRDKGRTASANDKVGTDALTR